MEYRFRTVRKRALSLAIETFVFLANKEDAIEDAGFELRFRLRNTGEVTVRTPTISIALPENVLTKRKRYMNTGLSGMKMEIPDIGGFEEVREDFFEPDGRVGVIEPIRGLNPVLIRDHSFTYDGLVFRFADYPPGTQIVLKYRIDAEDMTPQVGELRTAVPESFEEFVQADE